MKKNFIYLVVVSLVLAFSNSSWAQCPEDTIDLGICDTFYVKPWPHTDTCFIDGIDTICINQPGELYPCFWYVHLLATHDSNTFWYQAGYKWVQDSITGFVIPLTWTHSNPSAYCSLSTYWNTDAYTGWELNRSVFRDHGGMQNRMLDLQWEGGSIIDVSTSPPYFRMMVTPLFEQRWWEGSNILLATLTFKLEDTMTVHIDSTFWPPGGYFAFARYDAATYVPRLYLPQLDTTLIADFSADPTSGVAPFTVQFTDLSTGNPVTWFWNFGDDSTSNDQHPTHTYNDTGYFDVKLAVSNLTQTDSIIKYDYIHVLSLVANFSAEPQSGLVPLEVQFTDLSQGDPTSWFWDFGDDSTSTDQHPTHTYNDTGHYDVKLVISNEAGTDSIIKYNYIFASCPGVIAGFVKDTLNQPIYPAEVEIRELSETTETDPSGYYEFTNLFPVNYTLSARAWGYATVETTNVTVVCSEITWANFILRPQSFSVFDYQVLDNFNWCVATGDFNQDNNVDIIALSYDFWAGMTRLWGAGDGTFVPQSPILIDGAVGVRGYFNSDDFLDFAVGCYDSLAIFLNDGSGDFLPPKLFYLEDNNSPLSIAKGYLDSDVHLDLVTTSINTEHLSIFKGEGNGDFTFVRELTEYDINSVDIGDFDKDGNADLVLGTNDSLVVLLGNGAWSFTRSYATYFGNIWSVTTMNSLADFNRDGNLDVIFALPGYGGGTSRIAILFGDGEGGFSSVTTVYAPDTVVQAVTAGDFDGDNNLDFAATYGRAVKVYFGDGTGNFPQSVLTEIGYTAVSIATGDFNKDGNADIVAGRLDPWISVLINTNPPKETIEDEFVLTGYTSVNLDVTDPDGSTANILANAIAGADYYQKDCDLDTNLDDRVYNFNAVPGLYEVGVTLRPGADPGSDWDLGIRIDGSNVLILNTSKDRPLTPDDPVFFTVTTYLPTLSFPADIACLCQDTLTFFWNRMEGIPSQYHFQLDDTRYFSSPIVDDSAVADTFFALTSPLESKEYYWRVRANGGVWSVFSKTHSFFPYLDGEMNGDCIINSADVVYLINYLFKAGLEPVCELSEDVNCDGIVNSADVVYLINYLFKGGPPPCS
jgi:PKD repeat protein